MNVFIWTEAFNCGEILGPMLSSYLKHNNWPIHVFGTQSDLDEVSIQSELIKFEKLDKFKELIELTGLVSYSVDSDDGREMLVDPVCGKKHKLNSELRGFLCDFHWDYLNAEEGSAKVEVIGNEIQIKLQKAIASLPEKQQLVFKMKYFEELKYEEISEILGTSVGALKASYHHAVKKIETFVKTN